jgi:hypothetical protein
MRNRRTILSSDMKVKIKPLSHDELLQQLSARFEAMQAECQQLRMTLLNQPKPPSEGKLAEVLRMALSNQLGWREEARQVLGDFHWVTCENCEALFPTGGKRRKNCGNCKIKR